MMFKNLIKQIYNANVFIPFIYIRSYDYVCLYCVMRRSVPTLCCAMLCYYVLHIYMLRAFYCLFVEKNVCTLRHIFSYLKKKIYRSGWNRLMNRRTNERILKCEISRSITNVHVLSICWVLEMMLWESEYDSNILSGGEYSVRVKNLTKITFIQSFKDFPNDTSKIDDGYLIVCSSQITQHQLDEVNLSNHISIRNLYNLESKQRNF